MLIFGNPKVGTALMKSNPAWMVSRYAIEDREAVVKKMTGALAKFTEAAAN